MAKIFYSMSGEGRGHAARAAALVDNLRQQHEVTLFAPDQAYEFLAPRFATKRSRVRVYPIPGLRFHYTRNRLNLTKTIAVGIDFWSRIAPSVDKLARCIRKENPNLIITDFEPILPRAAERCRVPYVSLDHQHFLRTFDMRDLPWSLRAYVVMMRSAVIAHYHRQAATIVTSFFQPPVRPGFDSAYSIGPILRPAIRQAEPTVGDYIVSYLRAKTPRRIVDMMKSIDCPVKVYGLGPGPSEGNIEFCEFDQRQFVNDLAGCLAVVGAAGNQTLGESLCLQKPILALPEEQHFEQRINAFYVQKMGFGRSVLLRSVTPADLQDFVQRVEQYRPKPGSVREGNGDALRLISHHLRSVPVPQVGLVA